MADLTPTPGWDAVTELPTSTSALGGPGGPMNLQAQQLLNKLDYLRLGTGRVADTITALKAIDKTKHARASVFGYYAAGDGGGGEYWLDAADTTTADNGGTVIVATDGGRWRLDHSGWVSIRQFGASESVSNNTPKIQAAIDAMAARTNGGSVYIPEGPEFTITTSLVNKTGVRVFGGGKSSVLKATANNLKMFNQNTGVVAYDMTWENFRLINSGDTSTSESSHCINLFEAERSKVLRMWFENSIGDGLYIRTNDVEVNGIHCKDTRRQGVAVTNGERISIKNVRGEGSMLTLVDIEPNPGDTIKRLVLDDIEHEDPAIPAVRFYYATVAYDAIDGVTLTNIVTTTLGIISVSNLMASNIRSGSNDTAVTLDMYLVKNAVLNGIALTGSGFAAQTKFKASACEDVTINGLDVVGGANIDMDVLSCTNLTINGLNLTAVGNMGLRLRDSAGTKVNGRIYDASTYGVYMFPVVSSDNTTLDIDMTNCVTGFYFDGNNGNVSIRGAMSSVTTPVGYGGSFSGSVLIGEAGALRGSKTYNPPSIAAGARDTTTVTVTGAALGDHVETSFGVDLQGVTLWGYVSAANTVTAVFSNGTAGAVDLASSTLRARVSKA